MSFFGFVFKVGIYHYQQVSSGFVEVLIGSYVDKNIAGFFFLKGKMNHCLINAV